MQKGKRETKDNLKLSFSLCLSLSPLAHRLSAEPTYCRSGLRASALTPRVTASQLATPLIDAQQLQESKHSPDNVFVFALCFRCRGAEQELSCDALRRPEC